MKKILVVICLCLMQTVFAMNLEALRANFAALLPNERAGVAIAYVGPVTETDLFVGNASFDATTLFEYGSITKVFTAIVLVQLADEGVVALDASLNEYLPKDVRADKWQDVTLQSLATHTAGLPPVPHNMLFSLFSENPYADYDKVSLYKAIKHVSLQPKAEYSSYSNFGFGLLGTLLSRATDEPYAILIDSRIFVALDMAHATSSGLGFRQGRTPII